MKDETAYWIAFSKINGLGPVKIYAIRKYFQSLKDAWMAEKSDFLAIPVLSETVVEQIILAQKKIEPERELETIIARDVGIITITDSFYPQKLKEIGDPPPVIYYKGVISADIFRKTIGIVGTRTPSAYGIKTSAEIGRQLGEMGVTVVSGFARGVDTQAHKGVLRAENGRTIAVLACGPDIIYPESNSKLYGEISEKGLLISEYPPGSKPEMWRFPARNRLISGLSDAVLIIEAGEKSGSLITSDFAAEQGREVFALPGEITNPMSKGCNNLIKQGAAIFTGVQDIVNELGWNFNQAELFNLSHKKEGQIGKMNLSELEKEIFLALDEKPQHLDIILDKVKLSPAELSSNLIMLELKNLIKHLPGNLFVRS